MATVNADRAGTPRLEAAAKIEDLAWGLSQAAERLLTETYREGYIEGYLQRARDEVDEQ